jgi:hypothetical protein
MNPNPSSGLIHFNTGSTRRYQFSLFDLNARLIYSQDLLGDEQTIDLSSLPNEIYLGRLHDSHKIKQTKIIINKA